MQVCMFGCGRGGGSNVCSIALVHSDMAYDYEVTFLLVMLSIFLLLDKRARAGCRAIDSIFPHPHMLQFQLQMLADPNREGRRYVLPDPVLNSPVD
jgi:hypothetical protein